MTEGYNGWSNYFTWCVHMHLSNDEGSYYDVRQIANGPGTPCEREETLKSWVEEYSIPELPHSMASDLLNHAVGLVDWTEVLNAFLSEDQEEEEGEDDEEDVWTTLFT